MKTRFAIAALSVMFTLLLSCKKNSEPDAGGPCTQDNLTAKSTAYTNALQAYASSQSTANCQAVVVAYDNYLAVAKNCSFVTQQQVKAIEDARASLSSTCK